MSDDLLSIARQFITPDLTAKLASSLGLDHGVVGKLISAGLPTVLAGLGRAAATPGGAKNISDILEQQGPNTLDALADSIGGAEELRFLTQGGRMLSGIFGDQGYDALAGVLGSYAGADATVAKSVLGFLAPAVIGTIGQQVPGGKIDASGLASLFANQKDAVAAAMPAGLAATFESDGGLANLGGMGQGAAKKAQDAIAGMAGAASMAAANVDIAPSATQAASFSLPGWLWIAGALIVAALAWWFLGRKPEPPKQALTTTTAQFTPQVAQAMGGAADAAKSAREAISALASNWPELPLPTSPRPPRKS